MKLFGGTDVTGDKHNEVIDGDDLIVARQEAAMEQELEENACDLLEQLERTQLPRPLRVMGLVCMVIFAVGMLVLGNMFEDQSLAELYASVPWLFYVTGGALAAFGLLEFAEYRKNRTVSESSTFTRTLQKADEVSTKAYAALEVPENAAEMDVLSTNYRIKNGEIEPRVGALEDKGTMSNDSYRVYRQGDELRLSDASTVWAIPLGEVTDLREVSQKAILSDWNKDVPHNKGTYKPYKMRARDDGDVIVRSYGVLSFVHAGEDYQLYIPPYELPVLASLLERDVEK